MNTAALWMAGLLGLSAMFSGSEAALFTLASTPRKRAPLLAAAMLRDQRAALTVILVGNLVINLAYFAWSVRWSGGLDASRAAAVAVGAVLALVLLGEILPKVLAHRAPVSACRVLLPPVWALYFLLRPAAQWLGRRLMPSDDAAPAGLGSEEIDALLATETESWLSVEERHFLRQVLESGILRAGELRRPLPEVLRVPVAMPLPRARQRLREQRAGWAAVVDENGEVRGALDLSRRRAGATAGEAMAVVPVLPELSTVARAMELLREQPVPFVLLVDEHGTSAGVLERGKIADTLLDRVPQDPDRGRPLVERVSDDRFLVDAGLPLHVFKERFTDPGPVAGRVETLGGLLAERLGRVPLVGDRVRIGGAERRYEVEVLQGTPVGPEELRVQRLALRPSAAPGEGR